MSDIKYYNYDAAKHLHYFVLCNDFAIRVGTDGVVDISVVYNSSKEINEGLRYGEFNTIAPPDPGPIEDRYIVGIYDE